MSTTTENTACSTCGHATTGALVCPSCGVALAPDRAQERDFFSLFGLPRRPAVDVEDLERRYFALSRQLHPDLFHDRAPAEQAASLRTTALVNRAYRTLKDPVRRGLYWLELHGESLGRDNERVPPELAALVFDVQERLEALREARGRRDGNGATADMRAVRHELGSRLAACEERLGRVLAQAGDGDGNGGPALAETKTVLSELHYLRTLVRDVDKELEAAWNES